MNSTNKTVSDELVKKIYERTIVHFEDVCRVYPRGSRKEEKMCEFLRDFVKGLNRKDIKIEHQFNIREGKPINNVVITKPATKGYENVKKVALQGHSDMVCQKTDDSDHNFDTMPIEIEIKGNKMTSKGKKTTLGADDGIGVACIMAVLESTELPHPEIQAIFTSDEEDGMSGAKWFDEKLVDAECVINIDAETEGVLYYGCAGGIYANIDIPLNFVKVPKDTVLLNFEISGLKGGHSGIKINEKHANANRLMGRALNYFIKDFAQTGDEIMLADISGGDAKNAITKKSVATIAIKSNLKERFEKKAEKIKKIFKYEYPDDVEKNLAVKVGKCEGSYENVMTKETLKKIVTVVMAVPNGVLGMHPNIEKLVETSSNLGIIKLDGASLSLICFIRSSIESKKWFVAEQIKLIAENAGAGFVADADFPEWNPDHTSKLMALFQKTYQNIFNKDLKCESVHAGLECGYFFKKFFNPNTQKSADIVAIGPTIDDVHVPEETLHLNTVEPVVKLLLNVLVNMDKYGVD